MVSVTTLRAPKEARKTFDQGLELRGKNKFPEAAASFEKAVAIYPDYAEAWSVLGAIQYQLRETGAARRSLGEAIRLDSKLAGPWRVMGFMACDAARWEDAVKDLDQATLLEPLSSAMAWFYSGLADYRLGRLNDAERNIRQSISLDRRPNSQGEYLLGVVLIAKKDLNGGADALRNYIVLRQTRCMRPRPVNYYQACRHTTLPGNGVR
jgi:tetratricopeptide (TPR) repeat protein